jgi:hypothetical protein
LETALQIVEATLAAHTVTVSIFYFFTHLMSVLYGFTSMTLGHVYDLDLKKNETQIKEVIIQAQGEMALEEYVKQVKETWTSYALDLVNYQNKCRLIRCVYSTSSTYSVT